MKLSKTREQILNIVLESLQEGIIPFRSGWEMNERCRNAVSNIQYKGVNRLLLSFIAKIRQIDDPRWMTFNQAVKQGYKVKSGAKGVPIEFWSLYDIEEKKIVSQQEATEISRNNEDRNRIKPIAKIYYVFNAVDIEGIEPYEKGKHMFDVSELASQVLHTYLETEKIDLFQTGDEAYYSPLKDSITIPQTTSFYSEYDYLSVLAHEICHSTGHPTRLNRNLKGGFGSEDYAKEELRAEISSAFLCSEFQLERTKMDEQNHQAYIQSWISCLQKDPNELFRAINEADVISDFVLEKGEFELYKDAQLKGSVKLSKEANKGILERVNEAQKSKGKEAEKDNLIQDLKQPDMER